MNQQKYRIMRTPSESLTRIMWQTRKQNMRNTLVTHLVKGDLLALGFDNGTTESLHSVLGVP
jgi:hypothetical protein